MLPTGSHDWRTALPEVTATVIFSGSAANMEVSSSTLCSLTERLMIEAEPIRIDSCRSPLTVEWSQKVLDKKGSLPHLTCQLPFRDPDLPKAPLSRSNRDSQIVKEFPSLDDLDETGTQSTVTDATESTCGSGSTPRRRLEQTAISPARSTSSALWSSSGAAMPEIIELTTRLNVRGEDFTESQKGVAFLVVFGHNDRGSYICDLPVRQSKESAQQKTSSHVYLSEEARLRVKVKVTPQRRRRPMVTDLVPSSSKSTSSQSSRGSENLVSRSVLEEQIAPLMERIRKNEELALEHREKLKRAMDVHVPLHNGVAIEEEKSPFCAGSWNWRNVLQTLASAVAHCDGGSAVGVAFPGDSDASTIATRESWYM
jgi:hypothetical protein